MYNRYIPQPDGSYRRRSMPEHNPPPPLAPPQWSPPPAPCPQEQPPEHSQPKKLPACHHYPRRPQHPGPAKCHRDPRPESGGNVTDFLKNLIPKDFDTGDLLIILLLLLMSGDCQEDQNSALLTLVLYLFL